MSEAIPHRTRCSVLTQTGLLVSGQLHKRLQAVLRRFFAKDTHLDGVVVRSPTGFRVYPDVACSFIESSSIK